MSNHLGHPYVIVQITARRWIIAEPCLVDNTFKVCTIPIKCFNDALKIGQEMNGKPKSEWSELTTNSIIHLE